MDKQLIKRFVILGAFLIILFGGIFGWRAIVAAKTQAAMADMGNPQVTVSAAPVRQTEWPSELQATASLQAVQGAMLTPQLAGMVTDIGFDSGAKVEKGQLLVQLNDATQRAQLQNDESALKLAKTKLAQQRTLYKHHNVSQLALQEAETAYTQARAAVSSDHATIAKLQVRAPFTGHLGLRQVSLGQYVDTSTSVVNLQQWNPIYAVFQIPQQQLARLATGQRVVLGVDGLKQAQFTGKLTAIGAQVESGTRNVRVQATLANPDGVLRPGMFGEVTVRTGQGRQVLAVPDSAITYNTYGSYVYVIAQGKQGLVAKEQNVQTGESRNGLTVVTRGLEAGERVVTSGQVKLHPGATVSVAPSTAASPTAASTTLAPGSSS
ncbi:MAG: efflux RND transporter periplasmic adaptor subunit [Gammaproteobacteria bacterium]